MRSSALLVLGVSLSTLAGGFIAGSLAQDKAEEPAGNKPPDAEAKPRVVKERTEGDYMDRWASDI